MIRLDRVVVLWTWALGLLIACSGCAWLGRGRDLSSGDSEQKATMELLRTGGPELFAGDHKPPAADAIVVVHMQFDVLRVSVPADTPSEQWDRIWRYVDELRIDPATTAYLARNGFRVGIGRRSDWQGLRATLEEVGARSERVRRTVRSGFPLTLDLGPIENDQSVFAFQPNGRLAGRTFEGGVRYLHIDYRVDSMQKTRTALRITPEIFVQSSRRRWQTVDGELRHRRTYEGQVYHDLAVELATGPGEFLVVGPARNDDNRFVLGAVMFREDNAEQAWDTIVLITPQPYRSAGG